MIGIVMIVVAIALLSSFTFACLCIVSGTISQVEDNSLDNGIGLHTDPKRYGEFITTAHLDPCDSENKQIPESKND